MGLLKKIFGNVPCEKCGTNIKKSTSVFRRQFYFCTLECEAAYVNEFPIKPVPGGRNLKNREAAANYLIAALGEFNLVPKSIERDVGDVVIHFLLRAMGLRRMQINSLSPDQKKSTFFTGQSHLMAALPYLYAVGLRDDAVYFEKLDIEKMESGRPPQLDLAVHQIKTSLAALYTIT